MSHKLEVQWQRYLQRDSRGSTIHQKHFHGPENCTHNECNDTVKAEVLEEIPGLAWDRYEERVLALSFSVIPPRNPVDLRALNWEDWRRNERMSEVRDEFEQHLLRSCHIIQWQKLKKSTREYGLRK